MRGVILIDKSPLRGGLKTAIPHVNQGGSQFLDESQTLVFLQFAARYIVHKERSADA
jgi:hypothetical protein